MKSIKNEKHGNIFFLLKDLILFVPKKRKQKPFIGMERMWVSLLQVSWPLKKGRIPELGKTEREKEREKENGVGRGPGYKNLTKE